MCEIEYTKEEIDFIGSMKALMVRHKVGLELDPHGVPVFLTEGILNNHSEEIFISVYDIMDEMNKEKKALNE